MKMGNPAAGFADLQSPLLEMASTARTRFGVASRRHESAIIYHDIRLDLFVSDFGLELASLGSIFERKRQVPAVHFFVVAQGSLDLNFGAADHALGFNFDRHIIVSVHKIEPHFAVGQSHLELVGISAFDGFHSHELHLVPLLLVIHEGPVEVRLFDSLFRLFFAERLGVLLALPGLDLESSLAVVRIDPYKTLERNFLAQHVRSLILLNDRRFETTTPSYLAVA